MSRRSRIIAFGTALALVAIGGMCAVLVAGLTGEILTVVLISIGLGGALLLVFLEVGLSEDRELARQEQLLRERKRRPLDQRKRSWPSRRPRR